jgi:hypothetical protein
MQIFLPYQSLIQSAQCLDNKRLNKQIVECSQILKVLTGETEAWKNHPAVLMVRGHNNFVSQYGHICCLEWTERGFKKHSLESYFQSKIEADIVKVPWWFGRNEFHNSHKSNLYRKNQEFYNKFQIYENLPYCWPLEKEGKQILRYKYAGAKNYEN